MTAAQQPLEKNEKIVRMRDSSTPFHSKFSTYRFFVQKRVVNGLFFLGKSQISLNGKLKNSLSVGNDGDVIEL